MSPADVLIRIALAATGLAIGGWMVWGRVSRGHDPIRIGVIVATSGPQAEADRSLLDAALATVDILNAERSRRRPLEAMVIDTRGDPAEAARAALQAIGDASVAALVGGTTSAVRDAITEAIAPRGEFLVSPAQAEGLVDSPALVTVGTLPNQRVAPAAAWAVSSIGPNVYLIGEEGRMQRVSHALLADHIPLLDGTVVGESWLGSDNDPVALAELARKVMEAKPDVVFAGVSASRAAALAEALRNVGCAPPAIPTVWWMLRPGELLEISPGRFAGDFLVGNDLGIAGDPLMKELAAALAARGAPPADARSSAASAAVRLVAHGVDQAGGTDAAGVRGAVLGAHIAAPGGAVAIDPTASAAWRVLRVGRIGGDGAIEEVWSTGRPVRPEAWPLSRSRAEWIEIRDRGGEARR